MKHRDCFPGTLHPQKDGTWMPCPADVKRVTKGARWPKDGFADWEIQVDGLPEKFQK